MVKKFWVDAVTRATVLVDINDVKEAHSRVRSISIYSHTYASLNSF